MAYYELYHHGILGQKWGVRRFQNRDGTRTNAGKAREKQNRKNGEDNSEKKGLTDKQKKAIKIGIAAVGVGLAAYGGYRLYQSGKLDGIISKGKTAMIGNDPAGEISSFGSETFRTGKKYTSVKYDGPDGTVYHGCDKLTFNGPKVTEVSEIFKDLIK